MTKFSLTQQKGAGSPRRLITLARLFLKLLTCAYFFQFALKTILFTFANGIVPISLQTHLTH